MHPQCWTKVTAPQEQNQFLSLTSPSSSYCLSPPHPCISREDRPHRPSLHPQVIRKCCSSLQVKDEHVTGRLHFENISTDLETIFTEQINELSTARRHKNSRGGGDKKLTVVHEYSTSSGHSGGILMSLRSKTLSHNCDLCHKHEKYQKIY